MNVRLSIFLVTLLIIVGGGVLVTQVLRTSEGELTEQKDRLYRVSVEVLAGVKMTSEGREISFIQKEDEWFIKGDEDGEDIPVNMSRWGGIPQLLQGPTVAQNLSESGENLGDLTSYGLDPPRSLIQLTTQDARVIVEVQIGEVTPTGDGYYTKVADSDTLFITLSEWVDVILGMLTNPPYPLAEGAASS